MQSNSIERLLGRAHVAGASTGKARLVMIAQPFENPCCLQVQLIDMRLGVLSRFVSPDKLLPVAFVLFAVSFLMIPLAPGYWWVALAVGVFGVGQAWNYAVVLTLLAGEAPEEHRAVFMGVNGMVIRIGQAMGPLIMAVVFAVGGMNAVFFTASGVCLVVFSVLPFLLRRGPQSS